MLPMVCYSDSPLSRCRWCDSVGSVEEIQAKLIKRQEAAAKRERAMAYALAHQWQARSRQQTTQSGFEPDKSNWGWNWLERWMAVRPWKTVLLTLIEEMKSRFRKKDLLNKSSYTTSKTRYSLLQIVNQNRRLRERGNLS
ncbi:hypothetical protein HanIR_Chr00c09g0907541 [Helianthus annuus]|nr:hypothetical protein HanIR_Chr00c09g0907541 [Helianthus annuus]